MKSNLLFELGVRSLRSLLVILDYAEVKQSDLDVVINYLLQQSFQLDVGERIVHWDNSKTELVTANMIDATRLILLMGKEVNRMRVAQHKTIKNFIKEAQRADEYLRIVETRKEVDDAYKKAEG